MKGSAHETPLIQPPVIILFLGNQLFLPSISYRM